MEFKRKQNVLRQRFGFRFIVCLASLIGSGLYLMCENTSEPLWGVILGLCGSALVWALVELFDFFIQTNHQYESERNAFWGFTMDYFRKMKTIIRTDVNNISMHELHTIICNLYEELNKFVFESNIYSISKEFEMCSNYIERMYWKFDACCPGIYDDCEERDECYQKLYDALILEKEEQESTSKRFFDGFFLQKSAAQMMDIELSFEQYHIPENMMDYGVVGNISDNFTVPGNIRKTKTFIPDLRFLELYKNNKPNAVFTCIRLLFRHVKVSMDKANVEKKTIIKRIIAFTKNEKVKKWAKRISSAIMVVVSGYIAVIYLLVAFGSALNIENYLTPFVYVSFILSALILLVSKLEKLKEYVKSNREYCLIIAVFLSFVYAALRVQLWPNVFQYEDFGTALLILASYCDLVFIKTKDVEK